VLTDAELPSLFAYARLFDVPPPKALEVALTRLSFATTRTDPRDRLIDAVIGLEAVLLAAISSTERGETSFRFRLNFAMLDTDPRTRTARYRLARDLYNLRSSLAHGGHTGDQARVGGRDIPTREAADVACEQLRATIARLLPLNAAHPYTEMDFWTNRYFGLA
jgi:hypothetical protein